MGAERAQLVTHCLGALLPHDDDEVLNKGGAFLSRFLKAERRIFAFILTLLPHRDDAEDVLQEASAIMWEKFDERTPPDDFVAWGCRIAYFRVQEQSRKKRRERVMFSERMMQQLAETMTEEAKALRLDDRREVFVRCMDKLGRRDRELLAERLKEGATTRSTADLIGRSVDAVYKSMAKIRKNLCDCVARTLESEGRS
jgi:RNA polymerase sigma-70 factor, ECF subfamily